MRPVRRRNRYQIACISLVATLSVLLVSCGGGVSQDEFDAVQGDLEAARSQVQSLESEKRALETQATGRELVGLARIHRGRAFG